ncbi:MAG: VTT domain-containing protein [Hyphomicrobium sp.]|jgi:membrane protein DedA with SNARE-associated domain
MALEAVVEAVVTFVREHESWAAPVAFIVAFGESFCFFSLLLPGTAILAGIAALLAASGVDASILGPAILAAGFGGALGYAVSFWIGLYFKDSIHKIWPFTTRPHLIDQGKTFFGRYGTFGVFLGHFFGPVRAVIPVVAGMFGMRQIPFQVANLLSAFLWAGGVLAPAFYVVNSKDEIMAFLNAHEPLVAATLFALALANSIPRPLLFLPTLTLFVVLGALHIFSKGNLDIIWLAGAAGAFLGDVLAYRYGSRHKADVTEAWPIAAAPEQHDNARRLIKLWGPGSVIISKFQGFNRGLVPFENGAMERAFGPYLSASAIAALLWSGAYLLPAALLGYLTA